MKTQGEIEAAICKGVSHFEQEYLGRGPTAAEKQLATSLPAAKGRDLLKQVRTHLVKTARPLLEAMVKDITGAAVVSLHHDISTEAGEEIIVFTLSESPLFREASR
jgi:uncharacterized protein YbcI